MEYDVKGEGETDGWWSTEKTLVAGGVKFGVSSRVNTQGERLREGTLRR